MGPGTLAGCGEINRLVPARRSRPVFCEQGLSAVMAELRPRTAPRTRPRGPRPVSSCRVRSAPCELRRESPGRRGTCGYAGATPGLCYVRLCSGRCHGCCARQERVHVPAVPTAPQPPPSLLARALPTLGSANSADTVRSETAGITSRVSGALGSQRCAPCPP